MYFISCCRHVKLKRASHHPRAGFKLATCPRILCKENGGLLLHQCFAYDLLIIYDAQFRVHCVSVYLFLMTFPYYFSHLIYLIPHFDYQFMFCAQMGAGGGQVGKHLPLTVPLLQPPVPFCELSPAFFLMT